MRQTVFSISGALGIHRLFAFLNRNRPTVLAFHGVTAEKPGHPCNYEGQHLYLPIFARLMGYIADRYHAVPLARVVDWLEGSGEVPERAVAITFDDGYRNVLANAAPVLERLGIPATVFVATDFVHGGRMLWPDRLVSALHLSGERHLAVEWNGERMEIALRSDGERIQGHRRLLSVCKSLPDAERVAWIDEIVGRLGVDEVRLAGAWDDHRPLDPVELKRLPELGIEIGSHTCGHRIVTRLTPDETRRELEESKRLIEASVGRPCVEFSYPNGAPGDFDERTRRQVIAAGYRCAVTTVKTSVPGGQDRFEIPRCVLTHNAITVAEFAGEVSGYPTFLRAVKSRVTGRGRSRTGRAGASPRSEQGTA